MADNNEKEEIKDDVAKDGSVNEAEEPVSEETARTEKDNSETNPEEASDETGEVKEEEASESEETPSKSKKSIRKEKKEKKDKKDLKIEELTDRLVRLMAEYDNYRKRTDREKSMMYEMGVKSIVEKIIPVIDNFERGFDSIKDEDKENPFVQGMDKIYTQFITTLSEAGVKAIEAVGKEFDPNMHNAVMHVEDESLGDNIVAEEFQKGYMYKDTVIRCSMVKVAN